MQCVCELCALYCVYKVLLWFLTEYAATVKGFSMCCCGHNKKVPDVYTILNKNVSCIVYSSESHHSFT